MWNIESFRLEDVIGYGSFGNVCCMMFFLNTLFTLSQVYKAVEISTSDVYAIKAISKSKLVKINKIEIAFNEKKALEILNYPGVARFYSTMKDSSTLYFVLEYCIHGDLKSILDIYGSFPIEVVIYIMAQLIDTLSYVHSQNIIYGDMKLENLIVDSLWNVKLCDFGSAVEIFDHQQSINNHLTTAHVMPPETARDGIYGYKGDVWSLGCICYEMIIGHALFKEATDYLTLEKIKTASKNICEMLKDLPKDMEELLLLMLQEDPELRSNPAELKNHKVFSAIDWKQLYIKQSPLSKLKQS